MAVKSGSTNHLYWQCSMGFEYEDGAFRIGITFSQGVGVLKSKLAQNHFSAKRVRRVQSNKGRRSNWP